MKVGSGILPFGDYCNSPLSLDFNNSGPVGMVTFTDTCSDAGLVVVDLCGLSQIIKTYFKRISSLSP